MAPLPVVDQRHPWLRYQIEEYTEEIMCNFKGLTAKMRQDLAVRLRMVYFGEGQQMSDTVMDLDTVDTMCFQLGGVRRRMTWRQFILALGLHTEQEMEEARFGAYWAGSDRLIPDKGDLRDYWMEISSDRDFLGSAPSYVLIRDPYLFRHAEGRKSEARLSGGHFIRRLAMHFGLVSDEGLRGLQGLERQQATAVGALEADKFGQAAEEVAPEIPAPTLAQAPPPPPPALQPRTMSQRIERIEEEVHDLRHDVVGLRGDVTSFTTEQSRVST
ncbi:hypothetical protein Tco_1382154 [Tanacetum coccineum]